VIGLDETELAVELSLGCRSGVPKCPARMRLVWVELHTAPHLTSPRPPLASQTLFSNVISISPGTKTFPSLSENLFFTEKSVSQKSSVCGGENTHAKSHTF
jgi:hypothetical protein